MTHVLDHGGAALRPAAGALSSAMETPDWDDFKPHLTEIRAVVIDNNIQGSDPVLCVRDPDGRNWTVELASRTRNAEIGLKASAALPGDPVRIIGRRTRHFGEQRIKAVHLEIAGRSFALYPGAIG